MKKRVQLKNGAVAYVDFFCIIEDGKTTYYIQTNGSFKTVTSKVYYRPERTWDDHMGNTPCGYYVIAPFPNGERHRVYIY